MAFDSSNRSHTENLREDLEDIGPELGTVDDQDVAQRRHQHGLKSAHCRRVCIEPDQCGESLEQAVIEQCVGWVSNSSEQKFDKRGQHHLDMRPHSLVMHTVLLLPLPHRTLTTDHDSDLCLARRAAGTGVASLDMQYDSDCRRGALLWSGDSGVWGSLLALGVRRRGRQGTEDGHADGKGHAALTEVDVV